MPCFNTTWAHISDLRLNRGHYPSTSWCPLHDEHTWAGSVLCCAMLERFLIQKPHLESSGKSVPWESMDRQRPWGSFVRKWKISLCPWQAIFYPRGAYWECPVTLSKHISRVFNAFSRPDSIIWDNRRWLQLVKQGWLAGDTASPSSPPLTHIPETAWLGQHSSTLRSAPVLPLLALPFRSSRQSSSSC